MWTRVGRGAAALALLGAVAGCAKPAALSVEGAWVRLNAVAGRPAAGYLTLRGGAADIVLVGVATPVARAELHESMAGGMRPLARVAVPAGATVTLAPGGSHVMLVDPDPRLRPGASVPLRLDFADGRRLATRARVVGAADPSPYGP